MPVILHIRILLLLIGCTTTCATAGEDICFVRRELKWGDALNLKEFGGPEILVVMRGREMTHVAAEIADYTQMIPVARTNIQGVEVNRRNDTATVYGSNSVDLVPTKSSLRIEKRDGVPMVGSRSEMYLLYSEPLTGLKVYFLDEIGRQNADQLVVAVPKAQSTSEQRKAPTPAPNPATVPSTGNLGVVSEELLKRYFDLQTERQALDVSNPEAVKRFNTKAAAYHAALNDARESVRQK